MPSPLKLSLDEIRREAREEVAFLMETNAKFPKWDWPRDMLRFAREFEALSMEHPIDKQRARDFTIRLRTHVRKEQLKGMEPTIWRAEALEDLVQK